MGWLKTQANGIKGYTLCAGEGDSFTLPGTCDVAYGTNGHYYCLFGKTGTITFDTSTFYNSDPAESVAKAGYYRTGGPKPPLASGNNLIGYGLGDWGTPANNNVELIETCQYYEDTITMQQWAAALGNTTDSSYYAKLASYIKVDFNAKYFNTSTHCYGKLQADNAMPLYLGMVPAGEENNVLNALINSVVNTTYHVNCGEVGHRYLLQALSKYNRNDVAHKMIVNPTQPSFGYWASIGKTTTPEWWSGGGSQAHCMMDHVNEWFAGSVGGINIIKPGYEEISIKPSAMTDTVSAKYSLETVRGTVSLGWTKSANAWSLKIVMPANSKAKVFIPTFGLNGVTITEGSTKIWNNGSTSGGVIGVSCSGLEGSYPSLYNYVIFNVGSGTYDFRITG
jgi:alpha-L-rhamnosidase